MPFCSNCGRQSEGGSFCANCGSSLRALEDTIPQRNVIVGTCPNCTKSILSTDDTIIISGMQYHRSCYIISTGPEPTKIDVNAKNRETCQGCGETIIHGGEEILVQSGKEWHRRCSAVNFQREIKKNTIDNSEECPKCGIRITPGFQTSELIVSGGRHYHRACLDVKHQQPTVRKINNVDICTKCSREILQGEEKVIIGGNPIHRECYRLQ